MIPVVCVLSSLLFTDLVDLRCKKTKQNNSSVWFIVEVIQHVITLAPASPVRVSCNCKPTIFGFLT